MAARARLAPSRNRADGLQESGRGATLQLRRRNARGDRKSVVLSNDLAPASPNRGDRRHFVRLLALAEHLADDALEIRAWAGASASAATSDLQRLFDFFNRLLD
jgi:hypothetical protein